MNKLLSGLSKDVYIMTGEEGPVFTVEDILEDIESSKEKELFIAIGKECKVDAYDIFDTTFEYASQDMYEDWFEHIMLDVTEKDVEDLQRIFDRILKRNPLQNTSYREGERVIFDVEEVIENEGGNEE